MLPTEHHGACWELLGTTARDVLARRQGEALGRHCSDCVGQRDRSLVHLWVERDPGTVGRKLGQVVPPRWESPAGPPPFPIPFSSGVLPRYRPSCLSIPGPSRQRESPLGTWGRASKPYHSPTQGRPFLFLGLNLPTCKGGLIIAP